MKDVVSVTGGSGGIGQALLALLSARYEVRSLFRSKTDLTDMWERRGIQPVWGDLEDERALAQLVDGARYVFHCAAVVGRPSYAESYAVNVEGTRRLARAAGVSGCQRFIHVSSAAVYSGAQTEADYTEGSDLTATDDLSVYALTKLQAERELRNLSKQYDFELTIVRPSCVYGPHTKSYTTVPIHLVRRGLPVFLGDGTGLLNVVYVDDVASALLQAAESSAAAGEVFNIGHETVSFMEFYSYFGRMLGRPVRRLSKPLAQGLVRLLGVSRRTATMRNGITLLLRSSENTKSFPFEKARLLLGYAPKYSLAVGMLETELWAKESKLFPAIRYSVPFYDILPFRPAAVVYPSTEWELAQIVEIARSRGCRVRAIGSLHSQCPVPYTDGICVALNQYNNLVKLLGDRVTVQSGMTIRNLNEALATRNLALEINGSITAQTISGAISTATHGGSVHHGSVGDAVERLRIVRANGVVIELDRTDERFGAAVVSLGLLGMISTVTLRCVSAFRLKSSNEVRTTSEALRTFDALNKDNDYVDMLYFPIIDKLEILCINPADPGATDDSNDDRGQPGTSPPAVDTRMSHRMRLLGLKGAARVLRRSRSAQRTLARRLIGSHYRPRIGRSDRVLAFGDSDSSGRSPGIIRDMEIAVPYERACEAVVALRDHFSTVQKYPLFPIHIRCSPRSEQWLSPAYRQSVCWLEFYSYPRSDRLFDEIHDVLKPFQYRIHWGKETVASPEYIKSQYGRWDDFVALRAEWDPSGIFLNDYLADLLAE